MATSRKLTQHFLTCTVCMDAFVDPITLNCYHTFCRKCIVTFTKTQPDAVVAKVLPCPFCRKKTKLPDPDKPVDEWTRGMKPSFLIQGLLDSFGPGSKDTCYCDYCKGEGEVTLATAWCPVCDESFCEQCVKMHNRVPSFRSHDVDGISGEVSVKRRRKLMCKDHKTECVAFLCKDCRMVVCQKCCIINHRRCFSVVTVESELPIMKEALEKSREILRKKHEQAKSDTEKTKEEINAVRRTHTNKENQITSECQKVRDVINKKENKLLEELKTNIDDHLEQLKTEMKNEEMSKQMYQQQSELIDQALASDCEMDICDMYLSYGSSTVGDMDKDLSVGRRITNVSFQTKSVDVISVLNELQLGEIEVKHECGLDLEITPLLQQTIHLAQGRDEKSAYPSDVAVLTVESTDTVVVTDRANGCVKSLYYRDERQQHSKLSLDDSPWSLTILKNNQVAITVPNFSQIVIVSVNPELKLLSTIATSKQYMGITTLRHSELIVSSDSPPSIDVLDLTGTVVRSVTSQDNTSSAIKYPNFLRSTKNGNILVSDFGTNSVLCMTAQGHIVFNYSPGETELPLPRGMALTDTGDILVADYSLERVVHLTNSGQFVRNILTSQDGLSSPNGLCMDEHRRLYVCLYGKGVIQVFSM